MSFTDLRFAHRRQVRWRAIQRSTELVANAHEGSSRDASHEIAAELERRADRERREFCGTFIAFVDVCTGPARQLSLRLARSR